MSYLGSFPKHLRWTARTFRAIARFWHTDKVHLETCRCEGCFLGPKGQLELKL